MKDTDTSNMESSRNIYSFILLLIEESASSDYIFIKNRNEKQGSHKPRFFFHKGFP